MKANDSLNNNINNPAKNSLLNNAEKMSSLERSKFVNIDRNLAARSLTFSQFEEDETLCRDLLIYICHTYQGSLFSFGHIDLQDFCKVMNYSKPNLQVIVPAPYQSQHFKTKEYERMKNAGEILWENKFENALYKLAKIEFSWRFSHENSKGEKYTEETGFKFLDSITLKRVPTGKTTKKIYGFVPNNRFLENLCSWFLSVNLKAFTSLRSYEALYLFLVLRRNMQHGTSGFNNDPIEFDKLLNISGYDGVNMRNNKILITKALNKILNIDDSLEFNYKWVKYKNSNYAYSLLLDFKPEIKSKDDKAKETLDRFENRLSHEYLNLFRSLYPENSSPVVSLIEEKATFLNWIWDLTKHYKEKSNIYHSSKLLVLGSNAIVNPGEDIKYFKNKALTSEIFYKAG